MAFPVEAQWQLELRCQNFSRQVSVIHTTSQRKVSQDTFHIEGPGCTLYNIIHRDQTLPTMTNHQKGQEKTPCLQGNPEQIQAVNGWPSALSSWVERLSVNSEFHHLKVGGNV